MPKATVKTCETCGAEFVPVKPWQKFCTQRCRPRKLIWYAELRRLAEAANTDVVQGATYERDWPLSSRAVGQFLRAMNPDVALELLDAARLLAEVRDQVAHGALCPMCSTGMTRRTVGLVCPVCGTDYARPVDGTATHCDRGPCHLPAGHGGPCNPGDDANADEMIVRTVGDLTARHIGRRVRLDEHYDARLETISFHEGGEVSLNFTHPEGFTYGCSRPLDTPCEVIG